MREWKQKGKQEANTCLYNSFWVIFRFSSLFFLNLFLNFSFLFFFCFFFLLNFLNFWKQTQPQVFNTRVVEPMREWLYYKLTQRPYWPATIYSKHETKVWRLLFIWKFHTPFSQQWKHNSHKVTHESTSLINHNSGQPSKPQSMPQISEYQTVLQPFTQED